MKQQWTTMMAGTTWLLVAAAAGCSGSDNGGSGNSETMTATGTAMMTSDAAGSHAGHEAAGAHADSTTMPSAGSSAGSGAVATAGTQAPSAGTGADAMAAAGAGTAGDAAAAGAGGMDTMMGMAGGAFSCGPASTKAPAELYAAAAMAFLPQEESSMLPCAFGSCHNTGKMAAKLALPYGGNLVDIFVDKPACEAPSLMLVDSSGGDAALAKSYVYLKLAAPVDASANLVPDPGWGESASCGQSTGFGARMPIGSGDMGVGEEKLAIMREWICAGAPGPM